MGIATHSCASRPTSIHQASGAAAVAWTPYLRAVRKLALGRLTCLFGSCHTGLAAKTLRCWLTFFYSPSRLRRVCDGCAAACPASGSPGR